MPTQAEYESQISLTLANTMIQTLTKSLAAKEVECAALREQLQSKPVEAPKE
jgi:hypothetical protein